MDSTGGQRRQDHGGSIPLTGHRSQVTGHRSQVGRSQSRRHCGPRVLGSARRECTGAPTVVSAHRDTGVQVIECTMLGLGTSLVHCFTAQRFAGPLTHTGTEAESPHSDPSRHALPADPRGALPPGWQGEDRGTAPAMCVNPNHIWRRPAGAAPPPPPPEIGAPTTTARGRARPSVAPLCRYLLPPNDDATVRLDDATRRCDQRGNTVRPG